LSFFTGEEPTHAWDPTGRNILDHSASSAGSPAVFAYLSTHGADSTKKDVYDITPVDEALRVKSFMPFILNSGLLQSGSFNLGRAMAYAAGGDNLPLLKRLCRALPDSEMRKLLSMTPKYGDIPLCEAASSGSVKCAASLLGHGARLEVEGSLEGTPLIRACLYGRFNVVKLLVRTGAQLEYVNEKGQYRNAFDSVSSYPHIQKWLLVDRFLEQRKVCYERSGNLSDTPTMLWSGVTPAGVELRGDFRRRRHESHLDYLIRLGELKRSWQGRVVGFK
jgi:hypothetical protein